MSNDIYYIWLSQVANFSKTSVLEFFKSIYKLLDLDETKINPKIIYDNKDIIFKMTKSLKVDFLKDSEKEILEVYRLENAEKVIDDCKKNNISIINFNNFEYPKKLKNIYNPPLVLYRKGKYKNVDNNLSIGMVGTRKASLYALKATNYIAQDLAISGACIVSGQAVGIDSAAHTGALSVKGYTVAFAGCGLDYDYPKTNRVLRESIIKNGVVYSEYPPGSEPKGWHFPIRNRLISGFSDGVIVMEGSYMSGSLHTAEHALEQGRDVFALPGDIFSKNSEATFNLIKQGASPVMSPLDILEHYINEYGDKMNFVGVRRNYLRSPNQVNKSKANKYHESKKPSKNIKEKKIIQEEKKLLSEDDLLKQGFDKSDIIIYDFIKDDKHLDEIVSETKLDIRIVLSSLTKMEIQNVIRAMPGRMYGIK